MLLTKISMHSVKEGKAHPLLSPDLTILKPIPYHQHLLYLIPHDKSYYQNSTNCHQLFLNHAPYQGWRLIVLGDAPLLTSQKK
jgi:hypothetical protein